MAIYLDKKYASLVSSKLPLFQWKKDEAIFRCPICGDSKKNKNKCRGYIYPNAKHGSMMFKCHNCGAGPMFFGQFLKQIDHNLYKEYIFETFKYNNDHRWYNKKHEKEEIKVAQIITNSPVDKLVSIDNLDPTHIAREYIRKRKIPEKFWSKLYYTENYKKWINENLEPDKFGHCGESDKRIVIPYYNSVGIPYAYQGRYIGMDPNEMRYYTCNPNKDNVLIYGLDRLEVGKPVFAVEGPFDSLFLPNGLAAGGSGLKKLLGFKNLDITYVYDNEPRNKEICNIMEQVVQLDRKIVIWPDHIKEKDINLMIQNGMTEQKVLDIIKENCYNGLSAQLKFNSWKKV